LEFAEKAESRGDPGFCCFTGISEGVLGKGGGEVWFFAGELLVVCVVGVVVNGCLFGRGKVRHLFDEFLWIF
jgi:hypothetical protein